MNELDWCILGLMYGWIAGSLVESFFHQHLGHASKNLRHLFAKFGAMGTWLLNAYDEHTVVHHNLTYKKDHVTQFAEDLNPQGEVDRRVLGLDIDLKKIKSEQYGLSLNLW